MRQERHSSGQVSTDSSIGDSRGAAESQDQAFYHVTTKWMLADILTKWLGQDSDSLLELVSCGHWTIHGPIRVRHGFGGLSNDKD